LFGNSLGLISGFPPPVFYSYSHKSSDESKHEIKGLVAENDFYLAQQKAQALNKPLLIDFTGWACVNCRRMEENVWIDPEVNAYMKNEFVLVSLYVDEKMSLPANEQFTSCITGKNVKTVGNKWSNFQVVNFNSNSQPQYVILSPQGKLLNSPIGYSSKDEYLAFLKQGKQNLSSR
jgi:thioredoxin-related protein